MLLNLFQPFKRWWQRVTDTKPTIPTVGAQRIRNERAQILTSWTMDDKKGICEQWDDLLTYADKNYLASCPKCKHQDTLYEFKWNLDNPVSPIQKEEHNNNERE